MDLSPTVPTFCFNFIRCIITIRLFLPLICLYNFYNWSDCVVSMVFTIGSCVWFLPLHCLSAFTIALFLIFTIGLSVRFLPLDILHGFCHFSVCKVLPLDCLCGFTCTIGFTQRFLPLDLLKGFYHWTVQKVFTIGLSHRFLPLDCLCGFCHFSVCMVLLLNCLCGFYSFYHQIVCVVFTIGLI